ncbi:uncharacterized protein [Eurosta solidaginis]|uniref:uncharacterized protein isoform X2 n=1 Tax=Eurosta solidaginis TaxID=178769 RepID=UPI003530E414
MKRRTKTDLAEEKRETYRTGGGTSTIKVENVSLRIASMLDTSGSGMNNPHDDDMDEDTDNVDVSIVEEKENDNTLYESSQTGHDWASWNPANLRQKKSDELCVVKSSSRKRNMEEENMNLVLLQQEFYRDENTRAAEKHELEKLHAEEKHKQELINLQLKNENESLS